MWIVTGLCSAAAVQMIYPQVLAIAFGYKTVVHKTCCRTLKAIVLYLFYNLYFFGIIKIISHCRLYYILLLLLLVRAPIGVEFTVITIPIFIIITIFEKWYKYDKWLFSIIQQMSKIYQNITERFSFLTRSPWILRRYDLTHAFESYRFKLENAVTRIPEDKEAVLPTIYLLRFVFKELTR